MKKLILVIIVIIFSLYSICFANETRIERLSKIKIKFDKLTKELHTLSRQKIKSNEFTTASLFQCISEEKSSYICEYTITLNFVLNMSCAKDKAYMNNYFKNVILADLQSVIDGFEMHKILIDIHLKQIKNQDIFYLGKTLKDCIDETIEILNEIKTQK